MSIPVSNPRDALVTTIRQAVNDFNGAMDAFVAAKAEHVARNITFVIGDMIGSNSSGSFVAADAQQVMTDFQTIITAIRAGGTIPVGVWNNVVKIK